MSFSLFNQDTDLKKGAFKESADETGPSPSPLPQERESEKMSLIFRNSQKGETEKAKTWEAGRVKTGEGKI